MLARAGIALVVSAVAVTSAAPDPAPEPTATAEARQCCPYYPYDGSLTFVRIRTASPYGGWRGRGGWAHDYPDADINMSAILRELTFFDTRELPTGGNVLTFNDPRLTQFPIAYVSEPDEWRVTESEAAGLRDYLMKGGLVIFDDFFAHEMANLVIQMGLVFPELRFLPIAETHPIWDSFYYLDPLSIYLEGPRKYGTPQFLGLFENNDLNGRLLAIANAGADIGDLWEWAAEGWYPVDPTSEAFRIGVNYFIYAVTH